jgi:hypothetical protein
VAVTWLTAFLDTPASVGPSGPTKGTQAEVTEAYWVAITGWPLSARRGPESEFATLQPPDGHGYLKVQVVGEPPPGMMHLDVYTDEVEQLGDEVAGLGAQVTPHPLGYLGCRSPGGLVFCIVHHDATQRPAPMRWPGGASFVDQVCLDIPEPGFDREADFWQAVTRWPHVSGGLPEFDRLLPPPGQPLRILLQRIPVDAQTDGPDPGPVRMHLDFASEDRDAEVARHVGLGGRVVRRTDGWTTLLDPSGRAYCITRRRPETGTVP